jgi:nuclear migration protein JNM1
VDARDVDFSDAVGGGPRRSYRTRSSRRRRRKLAENGTEELGDLTESSDEDETLGRRLARLKREAEEVRLELERREQEKEKDGEFEDTVEEQQQQAEEDESGADLDRGVQELTMVLNTLSVKAGTKSTGTTEEEFLSRLHSTRHDNTDTMKLPQQETGGAASQPSTLSAVSAFSDRLTALEAALGVSSTGRDSAESRPILPNLASLSTQVNVLSNVLATPKSTTTTSTPASAAAAAPFLDSVASKIKTLVAESDRLTASRKQALQSLADLHETRMRQLVSTNVHGGNSTRPRRGLSNVSSNQPAAAAAAAAAADVPSDDSLQLQSQLFLDEQSSKITALYQLLPTIQKLQPLLPEVLERLRTLSVIHAGAAEARHSLDDAERRQAEVKDEVKQWRQAVEDVERGMADLEETMKDNVKVVGDMVSGLEGRLGQLAKGA